MQYVQDKIDLLPVSVNVAPGEPLGEYALSSLQSRARSGAKVRSPLHVRPDRRHQAAAEVDRASHLILSSVFGFVGHGPAPRRCAKPGRMGYDPRPRRFRPCSEPGCMGKSKRNLRLAAGDWNRRRAQDDTGRILRVLDSSAIFAGHPAASVPNSHLKLTFPAAPMSNTQQQQGNF
jgi:hypothetical protein